MKNILYLFFILIALGELTAQSAPQYTQFFFNKSFYNPGYTGSKEVLAINAHYRHQWEGVEGAPRTATLTAHSPFANYRCGLGISVTNDQIGLIQANQVRLAYAYRVPIEANGSVLAVGLQGEFQQDRFDWQNAQLIEIQDSSVPFGEQSDPKGNFGVGIYYASRHVYAGLSMPRFYDHSAVRFSFMDEAVNTARTYHFMTGVAIPLGKAVVLKPAALVTYNPHAPLAVDLNVSALLLNSLWIGATYRAGGNADSIDAILQYRLNERWQLGVAYDMTLSELANHSQGSLELVVDYLFNLETGALNNIRFF